MLQTVLKRHLKDYKNLLKLDDSEDHVVRRDLSDHFIMLVSPHPDDEILMAGLALRLQHENNCQIVNIAVTLGSALKSRARRRQELKKATSFLDWKNHVLPEDWRDKTSALTHLIRKYHPTLIIAPHGQDRHPTHERTSLLLKKCLNKTTANVAWSEYWFPQAQPNLLVEIPAHQTIRQVAALEFHQGEIRRNPYHLRLLGWQMDTVRRGSEWLGQRGKESLSMLAGQLYRLEKYNRSHVKPFAYANDDLSDWLLE